MRGSAALARPAIEDERPAWVSDLGADPVHGWVLSEWDRATRAEGAWFDEALADKAASFFPSYLVHTKGKWAGRPFVLAPWQVAIVRMLFGWRAADNRRLFRRSLIWIARGNGKSEFAAGLLLLAWLFDGELGGEAYIIAADRKQAGIVFTMATRMVQLSPALADRIETFKTALYCPELLASVTPMSGQAQGKHGLSCSVLVGDEMHEWPDGDLYEFVKQSEIKREQPLEILISTAGRARWGYGWVLWEESLKIRDGTFDDPSTLVVVYAANDNDDWRRLETWRKANPNLGVSIALDDLRQLVARAAESPRLEVNFKRYHLNLWVGQDVRWLDIDAWRSASSLPTLSEQALWRRFRDLMAGRLCYGGLDLSSVNDLTALVWLFPPDDEWRNWIVMPRFWVPADNIERRARRDRVPYDIWRARGAIEPTEGNVVDYDRVIEAIHEGMEAFTVRSIAYDPHNATGTVNTLINEGVPMVLMRQGVQSLGAASKQLERLILKGAIDGGGHPVLDWMIGNVAKHEDRNGNLMPDKGRSTEKIDGVSATVNALALADLPDDSNGPSVYETRGILEIEI